MLPPELIRQVVKHAGDTADSVCEWTAPSDVGLDYYRERANIISPLGRIGRAWTDVVNGELLKHVALNNKDQIGPFLNFLHRSSPLDAEDGDDGSVRPLKVKIIHTTPRVLSSRAFKSLLSFCSEVEFLVVTRLDRGAGEWSGYVILRLSAWPGNCTSRPSEE